MYRKVTPLLEKQYPTRETTKGWFDAFKDLSRIWSSGVTPNIEVLPLPVQRMIVEVDAAISDSKIQALAQANETGQFSAELTPNQAQAAASALMTPTGLRVKVAHVAKTPMTFRQFRRNTYQSSVTLPAHLREPVASTHTGKKVNIKITNHGFDAIDLFWVTAAGKEVFYTQLAPNKSAGYVTYHGHLWRARGASNGLVVKSYLTGDQASQTFKISSSTFDDGGAEYGLQLDPVNIADQWLKSLLNRSKLYPQEQKQLKGLIDERNWAIKHGYTPSNADKIQWDRLVELAEQAPLSKPIGSEQVLHFKTAALAIRYLIWVHDANRRWLPAVHAESLGYKDDVNWLFRSELYMTFRRFLLETTLSRLRIKERVQQLSNSGSPLEFLTHYPSMELDIYQNFMADSNGDTALVVRDPLGLRVTPTIHNLMLFELRHRATGKPWSEIVNEELDRGPRLELMFRGTYIDPKDIDLDPAVVKERQAAKKNPVKLRRAQIEARDRLFEARRSQLANANADTANERFEKLAALIPSLGSKNGERFEGVDEKTKALQTFEGIGAPMFASEQSVFTQDGFISVASYSGGVVNDLFQTETPPWHSPMLMLPDILSEAAYGIDLNAVELKNYVALNTTTDAQKQLSRSVQSAYEDLDLSDPTQPSGVSRHKKSNDLRINFLPLHWDRNNGWQRRDRKQEETFHALATSVAKYDLSALKHFEEVDFRAANARLVSKFVLWYGGDISTGKDEQSISYRVEQPIFQGFRPIDSPHDHVRALTLDTALLDWRMISPKESSLLSIDASFRQGKRLFKKHIEPMQNKNGVWMPPQITCGVVGKEAPCECWKGISRTSIQSSEQSISIMEIQQ